MQVGELVARLRIDANQKGRETSRDDPAITFYDGRKEIVLVEVAPLTWEELVHWQLLREEA